MYLKQKTRQSFKHEYLTPLKRWRIFTYIIILLTSTAPAQWNTQSPVPTQLDIRGIGSPSAQKVFIATDDNSFDNGGSLFESADGGINWIQRNIPFSLSDPFYGLFFLDSQYGWAYGNDNYRTSDGGTTWVQLPFLGSTYLMKFYSPNFGLATGNFGQYISRDGGLSWESSPNDIRQFDFIDAQTGLGASNNGIYKTTDGGTTFFSVLTGTAETVEFLTPAVAVGIVDSMFVRSGDGGESWSIGVDAEGRNRLTTVSTDFILAWGQSGNFPNLDDRVFRSTDGGQSWSDLGEVITAGIFAMAVADQQSVVAADFEGNMFHSANAGLDWTQSFISPGQRPGFLSSAAPVFPTEQTGYFGYGTGFVIKTTDSGASWLQISSGTGESLNDIGRFANGNLIAVGDNGTILTNIGGTSQWILQPRVNKIQDLMLFR